MIAFVVGYDPKTPVLVFEYIKTQIVVIEGIHFAYMPAGEPGQHNAHSPSVHANEHQILLLAYHVIDGLLLAHFHLERAFPSLDFQFDTPAFPFLNYRMVLDVVVPIGRMSFRLSPTEFVESGMAFVGDAFVYKRLYRFDGPRQSRSINLLKRKMPVRFEEGPCLLMAFTVETGVDVSALNYAFAIVPGLPVTDKVDFFQGQFCITLGAKKTV